MVSFILIDSMCFRIFQSLSEPCEDQVCATASDGAIGWVLAAMQCHTGDQMVGWCTLGGVCGVVWLIVSMQIAEIGCRMLELMTRDMDNALVMAANNAKAILTTAMDKHSDKKVLNLLPLLYCFNLLKGV